MLLNASHVVREEAITTVSEFEKASWTTAWEMGAVDEIIIACFRRLLSTNQVISVSSITVMMVQQFISSSLWPIHAGPLALRSSLGFFRDSLLGNYHHVVFRTV